MELEELFKYKTDMSPLKSYIKTLPNVCENRYEATINIEKFKCGSARVKGKLFVGNLEIIYKPGKFILELMSFNEYLAIYCEHGGYYEQVSEQIFKDLKDVLNPCNLQVKLTNKFSNDMKTVIRFCM